MKFCECFTVDLQARTPKRSSMFSVLRLLLLNPGYRAVVAYRIAMYLRNIRFPRRVGKAIAALILVRLCRVPGVEINTVNEIGVGIKFFHPHDIVLGRGCRIGRNVTIYNGVTLGARTLRDLDETQDQENRYPTIEDGVTIFSGAKIIGAVTIGRNSIVGANAVVNISCEENSVVVGVPARVVGKVDPS